MRNSLWMLVFLYLILVNALCAEASEDNIFSTESIEYAESVSYSITALSMRGHTLHVDKGMGVSMRMIGGECIVVTAKHFVENATSVMVEPLAKGSIRGKIPAKVVYLDDSEDVAFLSFPTTHNCESPKAVLDENIIIGRPVVALKFSDGNYKITKGRIIDFWKLSDDKKFMVAEMSIEEGFSGGGVFDDTGNFLGLISGKNMDKKFQVAYLVSSPKVIAALFSFMKSH